MVYPTLLVSTGRKHYNQRNAFATSIDPDQPAHPRSLVRIHAVRLETLLQEEKLTANSIDPDQTARIHAGRKRITLVFFMTRLTC
jgi:hypothetical protein